MLMANFFFLYLPLLFLISGTLSQNPILPKAAILPVTKDLSSLQYVTKLLIGQDLTPIDLVVDLNGPNFWFACACGSSSNFGSQIERLTLKCSMANPIRVGESSSELCALKAENTITGASASGELNEGSMALEFWEGKSLGFARNEHFLFPCAPNYLLKGLASGAKGMLGLGDSRISALSQFSRVFGFLERKFSICLSSSSGGAIFLGGSPSISGSMMYTPLISQKDGYLLNVKSIKVSGKKLCLHRKGILETRISTVVPYSVIESTIYATFVEAYISAASEMNLTRVAAVAPFEVCFIRGANVPSIDLVLQSEMVKWRIHGRNSMVFVSDEVMCLGMLDGGFEQKEGIVIVIGGYQLENCVLEFNLGTSMLGFSSNSNLKRCPGFETSL